MFMTSCSEISTGKITNVRKENKLEVEYCKVESDKKHFRQSATIKHPDLGQSEYQAIQFAKQQMAENIKQKVKSVIENYSKTRMINDNIEYDALNESLAKLSTEISLSDVKVICSKVIRIKNESNYQRFVAIEMPKEAILNDMESKISEDDAMYQDYRRSEMRKMLDAEL